MSVKFLCFCCQSPLNCLRVGPLVLLVPPRRPDQNRGQMEKNEMEQGKMEVKKVGHLSGACFCQL